MIVREPADPTHPLKTRRSHDARLRVSIRGAVQGVGFRPYVYRLATELDLRGWTRNSCEGVAIEVEGPRERVETFLLRLQPEAPPLASIQGLEHSYLDPAGLEGFVIRESDTEGPRRALVLPDIATCPDCLRDILSPGNRRYRYPFTNCTNCGPRFTIIEALPYDRQSTTMRKFRMCEQCLEEYENPLDRRFHAQPNACPNCGPQLALWNAAGEKLSVRDGALSACADALLEGKIVAFKGIGGFHLMVDARNSDAVAELRRRKRRDEKPLAVMYPTLELVRKDCEVSTSEERLLVSPEAPIVLLTRKQTANRGLASGIAPDNPTCGVMLPYTPLHHLLLADLGFPVVATSGNLSDETICIDETEAVRRLGSITDLFLVHDRPIARHADDSVARIMGGRELVLRRARGYAPLPVVRLDEGKPILGVGAHLKNSVALRAGTSLMTSQHVGDLETPEAYSAFIRVSEDLLELNGVRPAVIAHDLHPDYLSTRFARTMGIQTLPVQHHFAHVAACMAENELSGRVLGVSWDGTGLGTDGTVWGGEFLRADRSEFERVSHWRTFRLPGGDRASREPRRAALGLLYEIFGNEVAEVAERFLPAFEEGELPPLLRALSRGVNAPATSSAGRLFDAVASLVGLCQISRFEGQAAMKLEFALSRDAEAEAPYPIGLARTLGKPGVLDWEPMVRRMLRDIGGGTPPAQVSARFHNAMVEAIVLAAVEAGEERVVLTGGCFQNRYLCERAIHRLREEGFRPYWHQRVPPNDGGISLGQVAVAAELLKAAERV